MTAAKTWAAAAVTLALLAAAGCGRDEPVGEFSNDLLGNEIKVDAVRDPGIANIVCHVAHFDRGVLDRVTNGNWFEDPSNASLSCQRVGPVDLSGVKMGAGGEEVFSERTSLFFKSVAVRRIVDLDNRSVVYVAYGRELVRGSAKMSVSAVTLEEADLATAPPQ